MSVSDSEAHNVEINKRTSWECAACGRVLPTKTAAKEHVNDTHV